MRIQVKQTWKDKIYNPVKVSKILRLVLSEESEIDQDKEHFWVFGLTNSNVIKYIDLVRFEGPLFYANASYLTDKINDRIRSNRDLKHIIIASNGINDIDASGEEALSVAPPERLGVDIGSKSEIYQLLRELTESDGIHLTKSADRPGYRIRIFYWPRTGQTRRACDGATVTAKSACVYVGGVAGPADRSWSALVGHIGYGPVNNLLHIPKIVASSVIAFAP